MLIITVIFWSWCTCVISRGEMLLSKLSLIKLNFPADSDFFVSFFILRGKALIYDGTAYFIFHDSLIKYIDIDIYRCPSPLKARLAVQLWLVSSNRGSLVCFQLCVFSDTSVLYANVKSCFTV